MTVQIMRKSGEHCQDLGPLNEIPCQWGIQRPSSPWQLECPFHDLDPKKAKPPPPTALAFTGDCHEMKPFIIIISFDRKGTKIIMRGCYRISYMMDFIVYYILLNTNHKLHLVACNLSRLSAA